jgi:hypothetical protein
MKRAYKSRFDSYLERRARYKEFLNSKILNDYRKMVKENYDKGYIIRSLQVKYKNGRGEPLSRSRIYNAINVSMLKKS